MAMPNSSYWEGTLAQAVANGTLSQTRLNDMATRYENAHFVAY